MGSDEESEDLPPPPPPEEKSEEEEEEEEEAREGGGNDIGSGNGKTEEDSEKGDTSSSPAVILKAGYLSKRGAAVKSWKRRFFVLSSDKTLSYYKKEGNAKVQGRISLENSSVSDPPASATKSNSFLLFSAESFSKNPKNTKRNRTFVIQAEKEKDKLEWMKAISRASGGTLYASLFLFPICLDFNLR